MVTSLLGSVQPLEIQPWVSGVAPLAQCSHLQENAVLNFQLRAIHLMGKIREKATFRKTSDFSKNTQLTISNTPSLKRIHPSDFAYH